MSRKEINIADTSNKEKRDKLCMAAPTCTRDKTCIIERDKAHMKK